MSHTVLVGRVPLHRLPPLRDPSIHSRHIRSAQSASPLAPPLVRIPNTVWSHPCQAKCHTRPRPPCTMETTRPCRCGGTTRSLPCRQVRNSSPSDHPAEESKILCDRSCAVLRACGRHHRRRVCCLLASLLLPQSRRERNALGHGREMEMGLGLGKSRG